MRRAVLLLAALVLLSCGSSGGEAGDASAGGGFVFLGDASASTAGPWINRTPQPVPPDWPPVGAQLRLTYDESRQRVLMFGGGVSGWYTQTNDLFEWNGDAGLWVRLTPASLPAAWPQVRGGHAMAYDSKRKKLLVFGGYDFQQILFLNSRSDLWELDSVTLTWQDLTPAVLPPAWPPGRWDGRMVYDSARDRMVLFGGSHNSGTNDVLDDLWEWDAASATWTNRTPSPLPGAWPPGRGSHDMIYDSVRHRTVVFGGYPRGPYLNDLWEWDGTSFVDFTPSPLPASWPGPRVEYALAFDPVRARMLLFGGYVPILGDTWEWDAASNVWTRQPASGPTPRRGPAMAFDAHRQVTVLFGGEDVELAPPLHDTWEYGTPPLPVSDAGTL